MKLVPHGFEVRYAMLFDRPTPLEERGWSGGVVCRCSATGSSPVPAEERDEVVAEGEGSIRDEQSEDGTWIADHRRLRFVAVRAGD